MTVSDPVALPVCHHHIYIIMTKTTPKKHRLALFCLQNGGSTCSVAEKLGLSKSMVSCISKSASTDAPKSKGGWLRKLQPCHVCFLDHYFELNSMSTVRKACHALQETFHIKACPMTVRKALHYCCYKAQRLVNRLKLLKRHYKVHLKFVNEHKDMTVEDWKKVVWSDEIRSTSLDWMGSSSVGLRMLASTASLSGQQSSSAVAPS